MSHLTNGVDGIIFVVDASDRSKFSQVKKELNVSDKSVDQ